MKDVEQADYNLLTAHNALLESILSHLNTAVAVVSPHLEILKLNTVFTTLFELEKEVGTGENLTQLQSDFWQSTTANAVLKEHFDEAQFDFDTELNWNVASDQVRSIRILSQLLDGNLPIKHPKILLSFTDVTEERENERGRNQRIRFMMHELRNPLSNISLCIELLADSVKENNQEEADMFLSKAAKSVQRMKELINNLNEVKHPAS